LCVGCEALPAEARRIAFISLSVLSSSAMHCASSAAAVADIVCNKGSSCVAEHLPLVVPSAVHRARQQL
jgi:hypothetical protein